MTELIARLADGHLTWYVTRVAGLVAYLLLFVSVVLGLRVSTRALDGLGEKWRVNDLHSFTSVLGLGFLGLHALVLLFDGYLRFSLGDLLLPFGGPYRPFWTGTGILAAYVSVAVAASVWARGLIGYRAWRALHMLAFLAFALALLHGLFAGTDSRELWARLLYWWTGAAVGVLTLARVLEPPRRAPARGGLGATA